METWAEAAPATQPCLQGTHRLSGALPGHLHYNQVTLNGCLSTQTLAYL